MARKDEILVTFLNHPLLSEKYNLDVGELPSTLRDALNSDKPIIKAIALIVDGLESNPPMADSVLRTQILQYLNDSAL
jgi:hypothetical protein